MTHVVVIGGSGFLGMRAVSALASKGMRVTSVSRGMPAQQIAGVTYINSTYDSVSVLRDIYLGSQKIIHLAWDTTPMLSRGLPSLELDANLAPLARLIECLGTDWQGELIFVSSGGAVYGTTEEGAAAAGFGFTEDSALLPRSYYGAAKVAAEQMIYTFNRQTQASTTILRPSNIYGPGQRKKSTFGVIPNLLSALRAKSTFCVRGDGTEMRDYLYIDDFLSLLLLVAQTPGRTSDPRIFNVSSGVSSSINTLIQIAERIAGESLSTEFSELPASDPKTVAIASERAREALHWQARCTLEEGLTETWRWMTEADDDSA
jgi:UDP-glucose 4-epimerase